MLHRRFRVPARAMSTCNAGSVAANTSTQVTTTFRINSGRTTPLVNDALVSATTPDPDPTNNDATVTTPVIISSDITISKNGTPEQLAPGGNLDIHDHTDKQWPFRRTRRDVDRRAASTGFVSIVLGNEGNMHRHQHGYLHARDCNAWRVITVTLVGRVVRGCQPRVRS